MTKLIEAILIAIAAGAVFLCWGIILGGDTFIEWLLWLFGG